MLDQRVDCSGRAGDRAAHSGLAGNFDSEFSSGLPRSTWLLPFPSLLPDWNSPSCLRARPDTFLRSTPPIWRGARWLVWPSSRCSTGWAARTPCFFTGVCMAVAGTIWAVDRKARRSAAGRALFILVLIAVNYSGKLFDIVYAKGGVSRFRVGGVRALECHLARGSGYPGQGQGDRDRCRRLHLPDERRSQALAGRRGREI